MKKAIIILTTVVLISCGDDAEARELTHPKTVDQTIVEIKSTKRVIVVPNTEHIDYSAYRQEWRRVNDKPAPRWAPDFTLTTRTHKDPEETQEIIELNLSDLSFKEAFSLELRAKGEGHTFHWRGKEYTTNLLNVIRKPAFELTDPYIERIVPVVKEVVIPTEVTIPKEEKATTEEK